MIKDALAIFSSMQEMQETENWLRYQFFVPFDKPDTVRDALLWSIPQAALDGNDNDVKKFINQSFSADTLDSERNCCSDTEINKMLQEISKTEPKLKPLQLVEKFQTANSSLKYLAGFPVNYVINKIKELPDPFSFKLPYNLFGCGKQEKRLEIFYKTDTQSDILYDHCAISSLHTVKYLIYTLKQEKSISKQDKPALKPTSAYEYINRASQQLGTPGYFTLNKVNYDMNQLISCYFEKNRQTQYETDVSKFIAKKENSPFTLNLLGKNKDQQKDEKLDIPQYNIDFYDHILRCNQFLSSIENKDSSKRTHFNEFMRYYQEIAFAEQFKTNSQDTDINNAIKIDHLLLQYQLERFFNAALFEELFKQSSTKLEALNMRLLLKFTLLPNAFHRKKYVQCAFNMLGDDNIFNNYDSNPEELSGQTQLVSLTTLDTARIHKTPISLEAEWVKNTEFALDFLSKVHFPFYEKCFFIYLYKLCEEPNDSPISVLEKMEQSLYQYCVNIYDTLDIPEALGADRIKTLEIEKAKELKAFYLDILDKLMKEDDLYARYKVTYSMDYFTAHITKPTDKTTPKYSLANRIKYLKVLSMIQG